VHDAAGKPVAGNVAITFSFYKDQNDPAPLWQEDQSVQLDLSGHYSVLLGANHESGLPLELFSAGEARWLGVRPEGQQEQPRILFVSVAYALKAADADTLGGRPASAFALANSRDSTPTSVTSGATNSQTDVRPTPALANPFGIISNAACPSLTSDGTATANHVAKFTAACNIENSAIFESGGNVGIGNTAPAGALDVTGVTFLRGTLSAMGGAVMAPMGTATTTLSFPSNPLDMKASVYNTSLVGPANYIYRWQTEPTGNNSSNTGANLHLLFGTPGAVLETGLAIARNGVITFSPSQTFPSIGTVTNIATGTGLTGGPITKSGTISIASGGVTNSLLANSSITVKAGSGMSGGGTVALGGTITLTNAAPSSGGTVTSVGTGTGLTGGTITNTGTISLNTGYTDARYLQLSGGSLTGGLSGTTATFSGALKATAGNFNGTMTSFGAVMPAKGTATASTAFSSNPFDLIASAFNSSTSKAVTQDFRWQAEPAGSNSATASGKLNLLFGSGGTAPAETGFSIASNGRITFASGQTFPGTGSGTVTSVGTGAGLTGGAITKTGTISIATAGVTNDLLANPSITVKAGSGLSGGGTVALGGSITLTNAAPSSGGTVTSVATGTGLTGGTITQSGTMSLDTSFTDNRYLQLSGGSLSGSLSGTAATFSGNLKASTGTFTSTMTASGAVIPRLGAATTSQGFNSNPLDVQASSFDSDTASAVTQNFRWLAEPTANNTSNPSASLNLLFGSNGNTPAETGLSVASNGVVTFAPGQTFPGAGTITAVMAGSGLTGGGSHGSATLSLMKSCTSGQSLVWNGSNWVCGNPGGVSGTANGIAYFSDSASLASTAAPTNGQILIGASGSNPVLRTLTAGPNISITNGAGSVTISAAAPTLPFFATGGERTGGVLSAQKNVTLLWGFLLPYNVTTSKITYDVTTADKTANNYDIGIFNNSGKLIVATGPTAGTTFASAAGFNTLSWTQGSTTLPTGRYYIAFTTNCASACAAVGASTSYVSFAVGISAGASTGAALPSTLTPPADAWGTGSQPTIVIH
jgi:hypothetical protein